MNYILEFDSNYKNFFGSIGAGSSFKYGIWCNNGKWYNQKGKKSNEIDLNTAIEQGTKIIDMILLYDEYIKNMLSENNNKIDFSELEKNVKNDNKYDENNDFFITKIWVWKYFYMIYPNNFIIYYSYDMINQILKLLNNKDLINKTYNEMVESIISYIRDIKKDNKNITNFIFCRIISKFLDNVFDIKEEEINDEEEKTISENPTKYPYNRILYGAPGTGKSYQITENIKEFIPNYSDIDNNSNRVFRTTLHPEYSYYDFVGSIKPKTDGDKITYEFNKGIFTKALIEAYENEEENLPIFLVLEEMSRANVSAVFGDIFQLLDRLKEDERNENGNIIKKKGESEYRIKNDDILKAIQEEYKDFSSNEIYIPDNLFIWGTLNTSDQNVFVMDNALKRRFEFEYIAIKPPVKKENSEEYKNDYYFYYSKDKKISWCDFYQKLDKYITEQLKLSEDKQLGQFYIKFTEDKEMNNKQIVNKLMNYLWNDVQNATLMNDTNKIFNKNIKSFYDIIDICSKILKNESNIELFDDTFIKCLETKLENNE